jgi:hypothetical protein
MISDGDSAVTWLDISARSEHRVQIFISADCEEDGRVELSSGTRPINDTDVHSSEYQRQALVPREPWRPPTEAESASLFSSERPKDMARSISIVKLVDGAGALADGTEFAAYQQKILPALQRSCAMGDKLIPIGETKNPAKMATTTINPKLKEYLGLHVDTWEDVSMNQRTRSMNRICVNIGKDPRYFLFLPIAVTEIASVMANEMRASNVPEQDVSRIGRMFMERFPQLPVVRCRLAPYEAYIAPTENLVHDGSTLGQRDLDQQFTVLGHIAPLVAA